MSLRLTALAWIAVALPFAMPQLLEAQGSVSIDDLLRFDSFGESVLSPNGRTLAIVVQEASANIVPSQSGANGRADIWLVPLDGAEPRRITDAGTSAGYWSPAWSPDGRYLSALRTGGMGGVSLVVWDRATGAWSRPIERELDVRANFRLSGGFPPILYQWVGPTQLLLALRADAGELGVDRPEQGAAVDYSRVSVLSTADGATPLRESRQLALYDVRSSNLSVLAEGDIRYVLVPPGGRHAGLVFAVDAAQEPVQSGTLPEIKSDLRLGMVALAPGAALHLVDAVANVGGRMAAAIRWSPAADRLAVVAKETGGDGSDVLFVLGPDGRVLDRSHGYWSIRNLAWHDGEGVFLSRPNGESGSDYTWRVLGSNDSFINAWAAAGEPSFLVPTPKGAATLMNGDVWMAAKGGVAANLTAELDSPLQRFAWPDVYAQPAGLPEAILSDRGGNLYRLAFDADRPAPRLLDVPADARLIAYSPVLGKWVAVREGDAGVSLLVGGAEEPARELLRINPELARLRRPERRLIRYAGPSGDSLTALLMLPADREPSVPLPTVVSVYAGTVVTDLNPPGTDLRGWPANSLIPYASSDYAVLVPSLPMPEQGLSDPCDAVTDIVLSAVDAAADAGVVDGRKLALHGHSFGGYNVYCILRDTDRFDAGVVMAGYADLVSLYSSFPPEEASAPHRDFFLETLAETGQLRMGGPPWSDLPRYIRNSPIHDVDRIRTPLLIVHGELDYVPVDQAERMFNSLNRLQRDAELVRYEGEGHVIRSPANIRDLHARIGDWLRRHLKP